MKIKTKTMMILALVAGLFAGRAPAALTHTAATLDTRPMIVAEALPADCSIDVTVDDESHLKLTLSGDVTGPLPLPNDLGAVTLDLNGWTIRGTNGVNGTGSIAGGNGSAAIVVSGTCGVTAGTTAITVTDASMSPGLIVGGNGGNGNPAGKGAFAVADADGNAVDVTGAEVLLMKGADGKFQKSPVQEKLEEIFDTEHKGTIVEPMYGDDGNLAGHKVILGRDYGPVVLSNDFGAVTLDLNGWSITGAKGGNGTIRTPGANGGAAITVDGESGLEAGATAITVISEPEIAPGQLWANGPIFAESNVGATAPEKFGYYFWWGDTVGYRYDGSRWVSVADGTTTISFTDSDKTANQSNKKTPVQLYQYGFSGDPYTGVLNEAHDAATKYLGAPWRMMTQEELETLCMNCDVEWTSNWKGTGVAGMIVTGQGAYAVNSIFLPATGHGVGNSIRYDENAAPGQPEKLTGNIWIAAPNVEQNDATWNLSFSQAGLFYAHNYGTRTYGFPIRAVKEFVSDRPAVGTAAAIVGGKGGDGNPPGSGHEAIVDGAGEKVTVVDLHSLVRKGDDGERMRTEIQIALEEIFDAEHTDTTVEPVFDEDGNVESHTVKLGENYNNVTVLNDFGKVLIDLNGHSIWGAAGEDGSVREAGGPGSPAITVVPNESNPTGMYLTITNSSETYAAVIGGDGGAGNPAGKGSPAIATSKGVGIEVDSSSDPLGIVFKGLDGTPIKTQVQELLEDVFDSESTGTLVEPIFEGEDNVGHKVTMGMDYDGPMMISNDLGSVTIDLNGWTIRGTNGVDGTNWLPGSDGGPAVVVGGASGIGMGQTALTVTTVWGEFLTIDLNAVNGKFPLQYEKVRTFAEFEARYNTEEYKTSKILLRRVPKGTYSIGYATSEEPGWAHRFMQPLEVPANKDYWIGVFELTEAQYYRVMGKGNATQLASKRPIDISYNVIRGKEKGAQYDTKKDWHADWAVYESSFMGVLASKVGLENGAFDLPTEVQWEIAARALSTAEYGHYINESGVATEGNNANAGDFAVYGENPFTDVGTKRPNLWGLYDTAGNTREWCRDHKGATSWPDAETPYSFENRSPGRVVCGGCGKYSPVYQGGGLDECRPSYHYEEAPYVEWGFGFRMICSSSEVDDFCRSLDNAPSSGVRTAIIGGDGGDGHPAGLGAVAVVDTEGTAVEVDDPSGLVTRGQDGQNLRDQAKEALEKAFDVEHTGSTVEPVFTGDDCTGFNVTLNQDLGPILLSNDCGVVTIDLNGHTISGTNGVNGTKTTPGGDGGPAIRIGAGASGAGDGATKVSLTNTGEAAAAVIGGDGGDGNPVGKGAFAVMDAKGKEVEVSGDTSLVTKGVDGTLLKSKTQEELEKIFDVEGTPTTVELMHEVDGTFTGYMVTLGQDYVHMALSNDFGAVTINLNGWKIKGPDGADGTNASPGENGGAAIVIDGNCDSGMAETALTVTDTSGLASVQLWAGGPYFAICNIGATTPQGRGGSYKFAEDEAKNAAEALGEGWRLPTKAEFEALLENCTAEWTTMGGVYGYRFTGKGDYESKSVFFPVVEWCCDYWSSTFDHVDVYEYWEDRFMAYLHLVGEQYVEAGDVGCKIDNKNTTYAPISVRAVRGDPLICIIGGDGGDGNPPGKGALPVVDKDGNAIPVADAFGLVSNGADGELLKTPAHEKLDEIFDTENTKTTVEPVYDEEGNVTGHKVTLGENCGPLDLPTDIGDITLDLNGWTISGTNGVDGTGTTAGGNGGAAITVGGESGAGAGTTTITVKDDSSAAVPCVQLWEDGPYIAECNVGATSPEESGYYFWWGDTVGYTHDGSGWLPGRIQFNKTSPANTSEGMDIDPLRSNGWIDADGNLVPARDAATAHWGSQWRMMTKAEQDMLVNESVCEWTFADDWQGTGKKGWIVKGKGDYAANSIFFPLAGYGNGSSIFLANEKCYYWSSTPDGSDNAWYIEVTSDNFSAANYFRHLGYPVRAVRESLGGGGDRPDSGSGAAIVGGDGGDGNPVGKGAFPVVDADGNPFAVTGDEDLFKKGEDGEFQKSESQQKLEDLFDTEHTGTTVEPVYDEDGNLTGHKVTLGEDCEGPLEIPEDVGDIILDLNGKTIKGEDGEDGSWEDNGENGGAAIVVAGESGTGAGTTTITVTDNKEPSGQIAGGAGGNGKTGGKGAPAVADGSGNPYAGVTDEGGLQKKGDDGFAYGDRELPWTVGPDGADTPVAYTNGTGQAFIEGSGEPGANPPLPEDTSVVVVPPGLGDTYREKWPEFADRIVEMESLRFTAADGDVTVGMANGTGTFLLEWTLDPTNGPWTVFEAGASNMTVAAGATAYFRQRDLAQQATAGGWGFTFAGEGTVAASGSVMSVLDHAGLATSVGADALAGLFAGCGKLTAAPAVPATTLGANCYKEMFKGCTALTATPGLPAETLVAGCYAGMFEGCSNVCKARVSFTNWVDGATADWLTDVKEAGEFFAPVSLPLPQVRNGSSVPEGWMIYQPGVEIVSVEALANPIGSFKITYRLTGLYPYDIYRLDLEYAAKNRTARESIELGSVANGDYTLTRSSKAIFGEFILTPDAHVKLSLYGRPSAE